MHYGGGAYILCFFSYISNHRFLDLSRIRIDWHRVATLYSIYLDRSVSLKKKGGVEFMPAMYLGICYIVVSAVL